MTRREAARLILAACAPISSLVPELEEEVKSVSPVDWRQLCRTAVELGVGPLLDWNLRKRRLLRTVREDERQLLLDAIATNRAQNQRLFGIRRDIVPAAEEHGYELVLAKETAVVAAVYPSPAMRYLGDIDVITCEEKMREAEDFVVWELGYANIVDFHGITRTSSRGSSVQPNWSEMLHETKTAEFGDVTSRILSPEENLIWLCWHDLGHRFGGMFRLLDIIWTIGKYGHLLDWVAVLERASSWGLAGALAPYCLVARRVVGDCVPPELIPELLPAGLSTDKLSRLVGPDLWAKAVNGRQIEQWSRILRLLLLGHKVDLVGCGVGEGVRRAIGCWEFKLRNLAAKRRSHSI